MRVKRELKLFEYNGTKNSDGTFNVKPLNVPKKLLQNRDVDGSIKEAKQLIRAAGFGERLLSINIDVNGNVRAVLKKGGKSEAVNPPNWRIKRPVTR